MATLDAEKRKQARAAARKAREMAAKLEAAAGIVSDSERKRQASITSRTIWIEPTPQSILDERERLEKDDRAWLRFFFPDPPFGFWYDFTSQQGAMIQAIGDAILHGGDQAIAASRGEGKTVIARRLTLKYALSGRIKFAVLFNATGSDATDSLKAIRGDLEENERLANYYREVCTPVERLEGVPQRAATMLVSGKELYSGREFANYPAKFVWCGHEIYLPHVPGSPAGGAIIATRGLDSSVRGLNKRGRRPDVAIIDDPDTEETARSEEQARKLEDRIDRAIAGLGGQQRGIARVLLTTLQNRTCVSFRFTDPMSKSSWKGKRFRFLLQPPSRDDLWEEYVGMVQSNLQMQDADGEPLDPFARGAHAFYLQNREAMEAGAVVANPHRYDHADLGDGTHLEESALQRYYNLVAKIGPEAVATEYDNDPPEDSGPIESGLSATRIQRQVSGYARHVLPPGCDLLTQGIDVRKSALHWVVRAWRKEPWAGYTVAYGVHDVLGTVAGSDEGVDVALRRAIHARWVEFREQEWLDAEGNVVQSPDSLTLIDAGWKTDTIYQVCQELGAGIMPSMGFGRSNGCVATSFRPVAKITKDRKPGDGWFLSRKGKQWLVCFDADRWKSYEHDRWLTAPALPGALLMFGEASGVERMGFDEKSHFAYARHIVSEAEQEELVKGILKRTWKVKSSNNHWLDASVMSDLAAAMRGYVWRVAPARKRAAPKKAEPDEAEQAKPESGFNKAKRGKRKRVAYL